MKKIIAVIIMLNLTLCSCSLFASSKVEDIIIGEIDSPIIIKPVIFDYNTISIRETPDTYINNYFFQIIENRNGEKIDLLGEFVFLNPKYSSPAQRINEKEYKIFIDYNYTDKTSGLIYSPGISDYKKYQGESEKREFSVKVLLSMDYSNKKSYCVDTWFLVSWAGWGPYTNINYQYQNTDKEIYLYTIGDSEEYHDFLNEKFSIKVYIPDTWDVGMLKKEYTFQFMSGNSKALYFDYLDLDGIPKIYQGDLVEEGQKKIYKTKSRYPVVSEDNSIFIYQYSENASYEENCVWKTRIEKDGKLLKEYETMKIVLIDEKDGEIYLIDEKTLSLDVVNLKTAKLKRTGILDKDFYFPYVYDGKLQYTCPKYEGGNIADYVIKSEK